MCRVESVLVLVAPLPRERCVGLLLRDDEGALSLPSAELTDEYTALGAAADLMESVTGLIARREGTGWVVLTQTPVADAVGRGGSERLVSIPFVALVPEIVPVPGPFRWVPMTEAIGRQSAFTGDDFAVAMAAARRV